MVEIDSRRVIVDLVNAEGNNTSLWAGDLTAMTNVKRRGREMVFGELMKCATIQFTKGVLRG